METEGSVANMKVNCPECGAMFVATPMKPVLQIVPEEPQKSRKSPPKGKRKKWGRGLMLGLVLAVSVGVGAKWWSQKRTVTRAETEAARSSGDVEASTSPKKSGDGKAKFAESVNPVLTFRTVRDYCMTFGGRVEPEAYSYVTGSVLDSHVATNVPPSIWSGIPMYFMHGINVTWSSVEAIPGGKRVFSRNDKYFLDGPQRDNEWVMFNILSESLIELAKNHEFSSKAPSGFYADALLKYALTCGKHFPAPVAMADRQYDTKFYYLNEAGNPSVLRWGAPTNHCFLCFEGRSTLAQYQKCLHELRTKLVEYASIAKEEGLKSYKKSVPTKMVPVIYIGDLDAGTREQAGVEYEFWVEDGSKGPLYLIREIAHTSKWTLTHRMTLAELDEELAFFSQFETTASTEKTFAPLYCYLTQRKILIEEAEEEAKRLASRFDGGESSGSIKREQTLTFKRIGEQPPDARIKLEAEAESGGKVVFSVEWGPGIIEDDVLTFTATGIVSVCARQWGNERWHSATNQQYVYVEVEKTLKEEPMMQAKPGGVAEGEAARGQTNVPAPIAPELKGMVAALEAVQASRTPANFTKMEAEWKALPETWKSKLQSRVIGASCAMYLAKGHPERAAARKALVDEQALWKRVSDPCRDCGSKGKHRERCRVCGGSGVKQVRCSTCQGTGNCSFCHGSGQAGGRLGGRPANCPRCGGSGHCSSCSGGYVVRACADCSGGMVGDFCRTCHGAGRIISQEKCGKMVRTNIEKALSICRGQEVPEDEDEDEDDDFGW